MPLTVQTIAGGNPYGSPFIGPVNQAVAIDVNVAGLTTAEIDAHGRIKPGVILTKGGGLIGVEAISTHAAAVAGGGNTGNSTIGSIVSGYGDYAPTETITITYTDATHFTVVGSKSGNLGVGVNGTPFASQVINFTATTGATPMVAGDSLTIAQTAGASDIVYGVVIEAIKLLPDNTALVGTFSVTVCTSCLINRDIVEDNLGRVLTAGEVAALAASSSIKST